MAVDKLVDSTQLDTDLTAVADAIRTKGGTSASLAFPNGFVDAIDAIETGGGGSDLASLEIYVADFLTDPPTVTDGAFDGWHRTIIA